MNDRKSRLMRQVEERMGEKLETLLPRLYNEIGLPRSAARLGVSKATLWYWYLKIGVIIKREAALVR